MSLFTDLIGSFNNKTEGFSARKLSAFVGVILCAVITLEYCNSKVLVDVLTVWLLFSLLCLGIITFQQIMDFKSGRTTTVEKTKTEKIEVTDAKTE